MVHAPSLGEKNSNRFAVAGERHKCSSICDSPVVVPVSDSNVFQFVADTGMSSQAANLQATKKKEIEESSFRGFYKTHRGFCLATPFLYMKVSTTYTNFMRIITTCV